MKRFTQFLALVLLSACLCAGCGGKAGNGSGNDAQGKSADATTMRLEKTEGTVVVQDEKEEAIELREKLPLYSGYQLFTREESYGWINLDDVKLAKMDKESTADISKEDKHLKVTVEQGNLFFNVTEPLADDETMEIEVGNMIVGIRGTCGWVNAAAPARVYILEGTVTCKPLGKDAATSVTAGEVGTVMTTQDGLAVLTDTFTREDIPDFVLEELDDTLISGIPEPETEPPTTEAAGDDGIYTLPLSAEEVSNILRSQNSNSDQPLVFQAGDGDNTLPLGGYVSGHVIVEEGVTASIPEDGSLRIDGTLEIRSDLVNDGSIQIDEDGILQVDGAFSNSGGIMVGLVDKGMEDEVVEIQNARLIVPQGLESTGYIICDGYIEGTVTVNDGNISVGAGSVDRLILNDGLYIDDGGTVGEFTQNGGKTTSAAQGYMY